MSAKPKKHDKILAGLRELCAEQAENPRELSAAEIAQRCNCSLRNIELMTENALAHLRKRMRWELAREGMKPPGLRRELR